MALPREFPLRDPHVQRPISTYRLTFWALLVLIASPLILDGARLVMAQWMSMNGPKVVAETPTLDALNEAGAEATDYVRVRSYRFFHRVPWRTDYVIAALALCAIFSMLCLRRGV